MLRWLVVLVLVANLGFFAWTQGWLDSVAGPSTEDDRDPLRLSQQVHPEAIVLLTPAAAAAAAVAAASAASAVAEAAAAVCLEAGPFSDAELSVVEVALRSAGVGPDRWSTPVVERPGVWLLFMGRFPDRDALLKKEGELTRIHVAFEEVHGVPAYEPGLSLGRFGDKLAADAALAGLAQRGVRTARVVSLAPALTRHLIRVDRVDKAMGAQVQGVKLVGGAPAFHLCEAGA